MGSRLLFPIEGDRSSDRSSSVVGPYTDHDFECDEELYFFKKRGNGRQTGTKQPRPNLPRSSPRFVTKETRSQNGLVRASQD